jgi:hypothetical protein
MTVLVSLSLVQGVLQTLHAGHVMRAFGTDFVPNIVLLSTIRETSMGLAANVLLCAGVIVLHVHDKSSSPEFNEGALATVFAVLTFPATIAASLLIVLSASVYASIALDMKVGAFWSSPCPLAADDFLAGGLLAVGLAAIICVVLRLGSPLFRRPTRRRWVVVKLIGGLIVLRVAFIPVEMAVASVLVPARP